MPWMHPGHPGAIKITARRLVYQRCGTRPLSQNAIREAIAIVRRNGWLANYCPGPFEFDRSLIFVPSKHAYAALFRCLDDAGVGIVPRGLVESRTCCRLADQSAGIWMSTYGLAIVKVEKCNVHIQGTSVGMAGCINSSRYCEAQTRNSTVLVEEATGLVLPEHRIDDDLRLRTALAFEAFQVDLPGLLDGKASSEVRSRWQFPYRGYNPADVPF